MKGVLDEVLSWATRPAEPGKRSTCPGLRRGSRKLKDLERLGGTPSWGGIACNRRVEVCEFIEAEGSLGSDTILDLEDPKPGGSRAL